MRVYGLVLLLFSSVAQADTAVKKTQIYNVTMDAKWTYIQPSLENEKLDFTTGKIQLSIKNNTIIPLTFGVVKVRHHCQKTPPGREMHPQYIEKNYLPDFKQSYIARHNTESLSLIAYTKEEQGPCGAGYGGVVRSEIIDVSFNQHKLVSPDHRMKCGERMVPVVWAMSPTLSSYHVYTDTQTITKRFDYIQGRDGSKMMMVDEGLAQSLLNQICGNQPADAATNDRWRKLFIHKINRWGSACAKYPEKCKKAYGGIYKGWAKGSIGVRG